MLSTNESPGPYVTVYPDSDKLSVHPGAMEAPGWPGLVLPRAGTVDYWHGEGEVDPELTAPREREPAGEPGRPVRNPLTDPLDGPPPGVPGGGRSTPLGTLLGARWTGATVVELGPGENRGAEPARVLFVSTLAVPSLVHHPDHGTWELRHAAAGTTETVALRDETRDEPRS